MLPKVLTKWTKTLIIQLFGNFFSRLKKLFSIFRRFEIFIFVLEFVSE